MDGANAYITALPEIVSSVNGKVPVLFDSGIRSGSDIFKTLAIGAEAVLTGCPSVFGLSLTSGDGVREVIHNFRADLELKIGLSGITSTNKITRKYLEYID